MDSDTVTIDGIGLWQRDNMWNLLCRRMVVGGAANGAEFCDPAPLQ